MPCDSFKLFNSSLPAALYFLFSLCDFRREKQRRPDCNRGGFCFWTDIDSWELPPSFPGTQELQQTMLLSAEKHSSKLWLFTARQDSGVGSCVQRDGCTCGQGATGTGIKPPLCASVSLRRSGAAIRHFCRLLLAVGRVLFLSKIWINGESKERADKCVFTPKTRTSHTHQSFFSLSRTPEDLIG